MLSRRLPRSSLSVVLPLLVVSSACLALTGPSIGVYHSLQQFCLTALDIADAWVPLFPWIALVVPLTLVLAGSVTAVRQTVATRRLVRALMRDEIVPIEEPLRQAADRAGILGRIRLVASPDFFAFCFGCLSPAVCISTAAVAELSPVELEAVLRHESWHVRRRDPLRVLVANALGSALFVVPIVRDLARHYTIKIELRADYAAVRAMGDAHPLAAALYRATTRTSMLSLQAAVGAFNSTNVRIDQLLGEEGPPAFHARPLGALVSIIALVSLSLLFCMSLMAAQLASMAGCGRC